MYKPSTETVVFPAHDYMEGPLPVRLTTYETDAITWEWAYYKGYKEPRYPVPAHRYSVAIREHAVEIVTGITKTWFPTYPEGFQGPYIDCELIAYYPRDWEWPGDFV